MVEGGSISEIISEGTKDVADAVAGSVAKCLLLPNDFSFGFAGDVLKHKTQEDLIKESETLTFEGLVPYGYYRNRRPY